MEVRAMDDPFALFQAELPDLAARYGELVETQAARAGLDPKTKQLINIAIQTANRSPRGVRWHAMMAAQQGATRAEIVGAVAMNLHLSGLAPVLDCLPEAVAGADAAL
jgi:AhpD family alkylhydroperoxidase